MDNSKKFTTFVVGNKKEVYPLKKEFTMILNHRILVKDKEIDWAFDLHLNGLNLSTMQFENTSYITKDSEIVLNISENSADYSENIADLAKFRNASYLLYNTALFCVGYVIVK